MLMDFQNKKDINIAVLHIPSIELTKFKFCRLCRTIQNEYKMLGKKYSSL